MRDLVYKFTNENFRIATISYNTLSKYFINKFTSDAFSLVFKFIVEYLDINTTFIKKSLSTYYLKSKLFLLSFYFILINI
jgi:hypothetical protein